MGVNHLCVADGEEYDDDSVVLSSYMKTNKNKVVGTPFFAHSLLESVMGALQAVTRCGVDDQGHDLYDVTNKYSGDSVGDVFNRASKPFDGDYTMPGVTSANTIDQAESIVRFTENDCGTQIPSPQPLTKIVSIKSESPHGIQQLKIVDCPTASTSSMTSGRFEFDQEQGGNNNDDFLLSSNMSTIRFQQISFAESENWEDEDEKEDEDDIIIISSGNDECVWYQSNLVGVHLSPIVRAVIARRAILRESTNKTKDFQGLDLAVPIAMSSSRFSSHDVSSLRSKDVRASLGLPQQQRTKLMVYKRNKWATSNQKPWRRYCSSDTMMTASFPRLSGIHAY